MNKSYDYSNRTIDLELLKTVTNPGGVQQVHINLTDPSAAIVAGIQKAIQRYSLLFMTVSGDVKFETNYGTQFLTRMTQGFLVNYGRLIEAFALANSSVLRTLADNSAGLSDDEVITDANLLDFDIDTANLRIYLKIQVITRAGTDFDFILPSEVVKV